MSANLCSICGCSVRHCECVPAADFVQVVDPDYVPPKVVVTTSHGFSEDDLREVARRTIAKCNPYFADNEEFARWSNEDAAEVVTAFLSERATKKEDGK